MEKTSTSRAPWFVIPADHKWFRDLAISTIVADTMDEMGLKLPPTRVDLADIRAKYHAAEQERGTPGGQGRRLAGGAWGCTHGHLPAGRSAPPRHR